MTASASYDSQLTIGIHLAVHACSVLILHTDYMLASQLLRCVTPSFDPQSDSIQCVLIVSASEHVA